MAVPTISDPTISTASGTNSSGDGIFNLPSSRSVGQAVFVWVRLNNNTITSISPPTGWSSVSFANWQGFGSHGLFYRAIDGSESSTATYSVSAPVSAPGMSYSWMVSGANLSNLVEAQNSPSIVTSTSTTIPALTTLGPDRLVIAVGSYNPGASFGDYLTWGSGTEFFEGVSGTNRAVGGTYIPQASAGSSGTVQYTAAASAILGGLIIAIPTSDTPPAAPTGLTATIVP